MDFNVKIEEKQSIDIKIFNPVLMSLKGSVTQKGESRRKYSHAEERGMDNLG